VAQPSRDLVFHPGEEVPHGASFTSVKQLREHIDAFIDAYNNNPKPFVWTKRKVYQRRVKGRRISQL
jgi:hypothetical protein